MSRGGEMIFLKTLISLKGLTISSVGEKIGARQANLSQFILSKGGGYLSQEKRSEIRKILGLDENWHLTPGIHVWKWSPKISHQQVEDLLMAVSPGGGIVDRIVAGDSTVFRKAKEIALGGAEIVYLFTAETVRIFLYSPLSLRRLGELNPLNALKGGGLDWSRLPAWVPPSTDEPRKVSSVLLTQILDGTENDIDAVDRMLASQKKEWTWPSLIEESIRRKISPSDVAKHLGFE